MPLERIESACKAIGYVALAGAFICLLALSVGLVIEHIKIWH